MWPAFVPSPYCPGIKHNKKRKEEEIQEICGNPRDVKIETIKVSIIMVKAGVKTASGNYGLKV